MSEVTPPPPPPPTPPPTPAAPQPTVIVTDPTDALVRQLAPGARLEAVITPQAPANTPTNIQANVPANIPGGPIQIETPFGRFTIQTGFPLPPDGPLQLQLVAKTPQIQFLITAIHGLPPQAALRALGLSAAAGAAGANAAQAGAPQTGAAQAVLPGTGGPGPGGPTAAAPAAEPTPVNLTVGATLAATLLKAGPPTGSPTGLPSGPQGAAGAPGAPLAGSPLSGTPQAPGGTAAEATPQGQPPASGPGAASGGRPAAARPGTAHQGPSSPLPPGTLFGVRITAFQPAAQGQSAAARPGSPPTPPPGGDLAPGNTLTGVVTGRATPSGQPIVQTHAGSLIVATRTPLPPGSTVTFEVLSQAAPTGEVARPMGHMTQGAAMVLTERWPGLEEAVRTLQEVNPAAAQQLINAVLPRPGATLAANILFFMVALSGGDLRGWFGDGPARILERIRPNLFQRLRDDFGRIRANAEEPRPGSDWRTLMIPFHNGAEIDPIKLFLRPAGEQPEDDEKEGRQGTRFLVDLDLSRMGRFQLDGLVYQKEKHLDLIVRTENILPTKIQNDIRGIFIDANDVTGLKGGITFQAAPANFIEVFGAQPPEDNLGLIV